MDIWVFTCVRRLLKLRQILVHSTNTLLLIYPKYRHVTSSILFPICFWCNYYQDISARQEMIPLWEEFDPCFRARWMADFHVRHLGIYPLAESRSFITVRILNQEGTLHSLTKFCWAACSKNVCEVSSSVLSEINEKKYCDFVRKVFAMSNYRHGHNWTVKLSKKISRDNSPDETVFSKIVSRSMMARS